MANTPTPVPIPQQPDCETIYKFIPNPPFSQPGKAELSHPAMARIIYGYLYSRYSGDSRYEEEADKLLENLVETISNEMPVCLRNGLLGLGCGLVYLLRNKWVEGDEDEILEPLDSLYFKAFRNITDETQVDWYGWLYYCRLRLTMPRSLVQSYYAYTFKEHAIKLVERLKSRNGKEREQNKEIESESDRLETMIRSFREQEEPEFASGDSSLFHKKRMEAIFWKEEIKRYQRWYDGELPYLYNTPAPAPEEKVVSENSVYSSILTWLNLHQKPKYLTELNAGPLQFTGKKVLDVGAGPIPSATCFEACDLYLLDPLMSAYRELGFPLHLFPDVHFIEAGAEKIPVEDHFFDVIISVNAIDHTDNLPLVAKELERVAKKNCLFCMHVNYHAPTVCEPIEINDTIFRDLFGWVPGLRIVSRSRRAFSSTHDEEDEYVLWSNL